MVTVENTDGTINTYSNFCCNHIDIKQNRREGWEICKYLIFRGLRCATRRKF